MKCFSVELMIAATAYILAETEEEAKAKAAALPGECLEFSSRLQQIGDDIHMTGETYNRDMPEVSLSPAMTIHSRDYRTVDLVEDFDEPEEVDCGQCEGTGTTDAMGYEEECPVCDGSGMIPNEDR